LYEVSELECVYRSCETDAVGRPAAMRFAQDAQSGMRLPETGSRRSRDPLSGSRMPLCASRTNRLAAGRRTASVAQLQQTNERSLTNEVHSRRAITYLVVATPTRRLFCLLQRRVPGSRLAWLLACGVAKWPNVERRIGTACHARGVVV